MRKRQTLPTTKAREFLGISISTFLKYEKKKYIRPMRDHRGYKSFYVADLKIVKSRIKNINGRLMYVA